MNCRNCEKPLAHSFVDLGLAPHSNAYLTDGDLRKPERYYPLKVCVCEHCWLVQTSEHFRSEDIFTADYAYFSGTSRTWVEHTSQYYKHIKHLMSLNSDSFVVEIGSNDGCLLKHFFHGKIPCLGVEPTHSTAKAAERLGLTVLRDFFSEKLGCTLKHRYGLADLIIANNVFAHVPDIADFTRGLKAALKPDGMVTLEFPHLMRLISGKQFDTVYHEHFSYLSLNVVDKIFSNLGLRIWNVEELLTHGGSLRIYASHIENNDIVSGTVSNIIKEEIAFGLKDLNTYTKFQHDVDKIRDQLIRFLTKIKNDGKSVAGYGAAAKGNTLLNYAGVKADLLPYVCDASPSKQGKYLPGSQIPILDPSVLKERRPNYIIILPWNIAEEVRKQNQELASGGTRFVTFVPNLVIS